MKPNEIFLKDLCDYYNVSIHDAIELGTRSSGRKPNLPGSQTCESVTNMTLEDIWDLSKRDNEDSIFKFYKDQGAWSSFRQVVRHLDLINFHISILNQFKLQPGQHMCEYGCGVAPFSRTLLQFIDRSSSSEFEISLSDVDSEHFIFGEWRVKRVIEDRGLNIKLNAVEIKPGNLPTYNTPIDIAIVFEVLEHVPSPVECIKNLTNQMNIGGLLLENFIKHSQDDDDGPDLKSAKNERSLYYDFLNENFDLMSDGHFETTPDATRLWRKRHV